MSLTRERIEELRRLIADHNTDAADYSVPVSVAIAKGEHIQKLLWLEKEGLLAAAERDIDVRTIDEAGARGGTRVLEDMPVELPGEEPDHMHFVLMPIGPESRRAAVVWLAAAEAVRKGGGG